MSDLALQAALRPMSQGRWVDAALSLSWIEPDATGGVRQRTIGGAGSFLAAAGDAAPSLRGWITPLQAMVVSAALLAALEGAVPGPAAPLGLEIRAAAQVWSFAAPATPALAEVGALFRRLEGQLAPYPILQCAACDQTYSLVEALDQCEVADPGQRWLTFACPRCGHAWTLAFAAHSAAYGEVSPAGDFTPRLAFPLADLEVVALPQALRVSLAGEPGWEIPSEPAD